MSDSFAEGSAARNAARGFVGIGVVTAAAAAAVVVMMTVVVIVIVAVVVIVAASADFLRRRGIFHFQFVRHYFFSSPESSVVAEARCCRGS